MLRGIVVAPVASGLILATSTGGGYYLMIPGIVRVVAVSISFAIREKKLSKRTFLRLLSRSQDETRQLDGAQARLKNLSDIR